MNNLYENISPSIYRVAPLTNDTADLEYNEILSNVISYGGKVENIDDDNFTVTTQNKDAFNNLSDYFDNHVYIDSYDINVYVKENFDGGYNKSEIDIDDIEDFSNYKIEYTVFLNPDIVSYSYYTTIDDDADSEDAEIYEKTNRKQPLWMALNNTLSEIKTGRFIVTPHPVKQDTIWVHIEYTFDKSMTHSDFYNKNSISINNDIDNINRGFIFNKLSKKGFILKNPLSLDPKDVNFIETYQPQGKLETKVVEFILNDKSVNVKLLLEMFDDSTLFAPVGVLNEIKRQLKINYRGKKRIKLKCNPGYKYDPERKACVKIGGSELATMRKSKLKMVRTKNSKGTGYKKLILRKTKKAMRFRKLLGK